MEKLEHDSCCAFGKNWSTIHAVPLEKIAYYYG